MSEAARTPVGSTYGGQALIEGVMIRGQTCVSIAVRRPNGEILVETQPIGWRWARTIRRIPFIRGVIVLSEMLVVGTRALIFSANIAAEEDEDQPNKESQIGGTSVDASDTAAPVDAATHAQESAASTEEKGPGGLSTWAVISSVGLSLLLAIGIFFATPVLATGLVDNWLETSNLWSNIIEGVIRLLMFVGYIAIIGLLPDIRRVFAYHGAEHMTIHAREHGQPLDTASIRQFDTAHPRCGTAFILVVLVVAIIVHVFWTPPGLIDRVISRVVVLPLIAGLSYEIIRFSGFHAENLLVKAIIWPNLLLQALTTRQPDDDQIEVAVRALEGALEADGAAAA